VKYQMRKVVHIMYELLTRREAYLFFLAMGGDETQLPEPLTPAEDFLYKACMEKVAKELTNVKAAESVQIELPANDKAVNTVETNGDGDTEE